MIESDLEKPRLIIKYNLCRMGHLSLMQDYNYDEIIFQQDASKSNRSKYYVTNP